MLLAFFYQKYDRRNFRSIINCSSRKIFLDLVWFQYNFFSFFLFVSDELYVLKYTGWGPNAILNAIWNRKKRRFIKTMGKNRIAHGRILPWNNNCWKFLWKQITNIINFYSCASVPKMHFNLLKFKKMSFVLSYNTLLFTFMFVVQLQVCRNETV